MIYLIILFLYLRTWRYNYLIDDPVPRDKVYLWMGVKRVKADWYDRQRPIIGTLVNIIVYMGCTGYIHLLWGWQPALLYSVFPLNVCGVAWRTGNYYQTSVLFCLATLYWMPTEIAFNSILWYLQAIFSISLYTSALNSAPNSLAFTFILPFFSSAWWLQLFPLIRFLRGRRWRTALIKRKWRHKNLKLSTGFHPQHIINVPKLLAYYLYLSIYPVRLAFFHSFGVQRNYFKVGVLIICCVFSLEMFYIFLNVDYRMCFWWFLSVLPACHPFGVKGQYVSERVLLLSNVAFCVIVSQLLTNPILLSITCTLYFTRSLSYISCWRSNEALFRNGMTSQPDTPENFNNLSNYYMDIGDVTAALRPLQVAEVLTRGNKFNVRISLAKCYKAAGRYLQALKYADLALNNDCPINQRDKVQNLYNDIHKTLTKLKKNEKKLRKQRIIT